MAKPSDIIRKIESMAEVGSPPDEVALVLGIGDLDAVQLEAHKRGTAKGRAKLRFALAKAAARGDSRCAALLYENLDADNEDDEIIRFRRLWRAQEDAEAGRGPA